MHSKYISIVVLLLVLLSACKKKPDDIYADINKHRKEIDAKIKDYKVKKTDDIISKGKGYITGYYRDDEVKKVETEYFFDTCRTFSEYYFDDGFLILILTQNFAYNRPQSYTEEKARSFGDSIWYDDKKTKLETSSYYFYQNNLVKWIDTDHKEVTPGTADFINKQSLLWAETKVLLMQLKAD